MAKHGERFRGCRPRIACPAPASFPAAHPAAERQLHPPLATPPAAGCWRWLSSQSSAAALHQPDQAPFRRPANSPASPNRLRRPKASAARLSTLASPPANFKAAQEHAAASPNRCASQASAKPNSIGKSRGSAASSRGPWRRTFGQSLAAMARWVAVSTSPGGDFLQAPSRADAAPGWPKTRGRTAPPRLGDDALQQLAARPIVYVPPAARHNASWNCRSVLAVRSCPPACIAAINGSVANVCHPFTITKSRRLTPENATCEPAADHAATCRIVTAGPGRPRE